MESKKVEEKILKKHGKFEKPIPMKDAAEIILTEAGGPMKASEITSVALNLDAIKNSGKTPEATMQAQLSTSAKKGDRFLRTSPGEYGLRTRDKVKPKPKGKKSEKVKAAA